MVVHVWSNVIMCYVVSIVSDMCYVVSDMCYVVDPPPYEGRKKCPSLSV